MSILLELPTETDEILENEDTEPYEAVVAILSDGKAMCITSSKDYLLKMRDLIETVLSSPEFSEIPQLTNDFN